MSDFKVTNVDTHAGRDAVLAVATCGLSILMGSSDNTYTVEDSSGNEHKVDAPNSSVLGDKISRGEFNKD